MVTLNPRVDFVFKKLFGSEENKDLLINLLNSIVSQEDQVTDLIIRNPYSLQNFKNEKLTILDIKAQDTHGKWFNVEMQIVDQEYYEQRALYYWARLYNEQLASGINYDILKKTIGINILNFNCLPEEQYHNVYRVRNEDSRELFFEHFEIHFVELEKYRNQHIGTLLDRWVTFLKKAGEYDHNRLPQELQEVPEIRKALEILENMNMNPAEREFYEARLKWLRDEEMALRKAEKKGLELGLEQGMQQGMQQGLQQGLQQGRELGVVEGRQMEKKALAQSLKQMGMDLALIKQATGLTEEEIKGL